ncbi:MAG: aromatic amino acid lyase, partial [bacterium]|nr:aromatic amino acid lyase [bacterium]
MSIGGEASSAWGKQSPIEGESPESKVVRIGDGDLGIEDVVHLARAEARADLHDDAEYRGALRASAKLVAEQQQAGREIYGVTTGVGASVVNRIPEPLREAMPLNLLRFHGVGTG